MHSPKSQSASSSQHSHSLDYPSGSTTSPANSTTPIHNNFNLETPASSAKNTADNGNTDSCALLSTRWLIGSKDVFDVTTPLGTDAANLVVTNLPTTMTEDELRTLFEPCGEVLNSTVMMRIISVNRSQSRGFGFVLMATREGAERAQKELTGRVIYYKDEEGDAAEEKTSSEAEMQQPMNEEDLKAHAAGLRKTVLNVEESDFVLKPSTCVNLRNMPVPCADLAEQSTSAAGAAAAGDNTNTITAVQEHEIRALFTSFGPVKALKIQYIKRRFARLFCDVTAQYIEPEHAKAAVRRLHGMSRVEVTTDSTNGSLVSVTASRIGTSSTTSSSVSTTSTNPCHRTHTVDLLIPFFAKFKQCLAPGEIDTGDDLEVPANKAAAKQAAMMAVNDNKKEKQQKVVMNQNQNNNSNKTQQQHQQNRKAINSVALHNARVNMVLQRNNYCGFLQQQQQQQQQARTQQQQQQANQQQQMQQPPMQQQQQQLISNNTNNNNNVPVVMLPTNFIQPQPQASTVQNQIAACSSQQQLLQNSNTFSSSTMVLSNSGSNFNMSNNFNGCNNLNNLKQQRQQQPMPMMQQPMPQLQQQQQQPQQINNNFNLNNGNNNNMFPMQQQPLAQPQTLVAPQQQQRPMMPMPVNAANATVNNSNSNTPVMLLPQQPQPQPQPQPLPMPQQQQQQQPRFNNPANTTTLGGHQLPIVPITNVMM